ncbi:MAG: ATP-binding protein [Elusimicrobia bacterium]|nr:ATP-binding protein [Elusimicrobiota bacterium]
MLYNRDIISKIDKVLLKEEIIILTGARQTGKTSIMFILKRRLEELGRSCSYFNLENPDYLRLFNAQPLNVLELLPDSKEKQFVFIDEVQYLDDPTRFLKLLYDEKRGKIKLVASGSSAFYMDRKFKDSLAGRKFIFEVRPLDFDEFLVFSGRLELAGHARGNLTAYYKEKLLASWRKYITYGGYPKVALAESDDQRIAAVSEIGGSYIKKDIAEAGIRNSEKYLALLKILASQTGQLVNSMELCGTLGMTHKTMEEYLYVIAKSYQAAFIKPFHGNIRKELTKMPKVYFYDPGLRNFFLNNFDDIGKRPDKGGYLENLCFAELLRRAGAADKVRFWRTQDKKEVDFVVEKEAFEVKFDAAGVKRREYKIFQETYPGIKLRFLGNADILPEFYGWKL